MFGTSVPHTVRDVLLRTTYEQNGTALYSVPNVLLQTPYKQNRTESQMFKTTKIVVAAVILEEEISMWIYLSATVCPQWSIIGK